MLLVNSAPDCWVSFCPLRKNVGVASTPRDRLPLRSAITRSRAVGAATVASKVAMSSPRSTAYRRNSADLSCCWSPYCAWVVNIIEYISSNRPCWAAASGSSGSRR
jgi:hypothetical protein